MFEKILTKIANYKGDFEGLSAIIKDTCEELKIAKLESFFYEQNAKEQPACVLYAKDGAKSHFAFAKKYEGEKTLVFHIHAFDESKPWTAMQKEQIQVFTMVLFTFYQKFEQQDSQKDPKTKKIEKDCLKAIKNGEFVAFYQPKVLLSNYTLFGAEALCRWQKDGKLVPPIEFIPVLEQSELICKLDFYMLECICKDIRRWLDEGKKVVKISVNLSRNNLKNENLLSDLLAIIDRHKVPHELIEIEILESSGEVSYKELEKLIYGLKEHGIGAAVDDFGTGFSSLSLLKALPWNVIKIDRSLLPENSSKNSEQYRLLSHLLTMLYDMGFKCLVEGVETLEHIKILKENNCYVAQGYYFDRPLPVEQFEERLLGIKE